MSLDDELCFQLARTTNLVMRYLRRRRKELGLRSGEARVLECLADADGQLARDIARACALDKSAMTPVLRGMEESGLVVREIDSEDGRASRVLLTGKGRERATQVRSMTREATAVMARDLSLAQREGLLEALHALARGAEEANDAC